MKVVYIHGASATSDSFNYIREHVARDELIIDYDSANGFLNNLEIMKDTLKDHKEIFFVAHSLGGIYALHLANCFPQQIKGAVTISTPYGGSKAADYVKFFLPFSRLLRDIGPSSIPMRLANKIEIKCPWTNIVTTQGSSPFIIEPNDGVVTLASMRHHSEDMELLELPINHYEVVMSKTVVDIINSKISSVRNT